MEQTINPEVINKPEDAPPSSSEEAKTSDAEQPKTDAAPTAEQIQEWYWNESQKGEGNRPDYLLDKYKSVEAQAKALPELTKTLGKFKGAPKDGYNLDNVPAGIDKDSPLLKGYMDVFKEMNLSQEGFEQVTSKYADIVTGLVETPEQITQKLGAEGKAIQERVSNWVSTMPKEDQEAIAQWITSAEDVKALDRIRSSQATSRMPTANESVTGFETSKAVEAEKNKNFRRYVEDEAYRAEISRRFRKAMELEGKV